MKLLKKFKGGLILLAILLIWEIASRFTIPLFIPSPISVFSAIYELAISGQLYYGIVYSFGRITLATFISLIITMPLSLIIYGVPCLRETIMPVVSFFRYVPITAFSPLLVLWFGIGEPAKISFLVIATFVYFLPSVLLCYSEVSEDLLDTARTMGMHEIDVICHVLLPASMPSIANTVLMMYSIGWNYIAIVEATNAKYGLGYIIEISSARGKTAVVFASIIIIMIFSYVIDRNGNTLIRNRFKWRYINDQIE